MTVESRYLRMRDGVSVAVDVYLPPGAARGAKVPAVLRQTRYYRAFACRPPFGVMERFLDSKRRMRGRFLERGWAWVDVDVRGSGASEGVSVSPWSEDEVGDGVEVCEWITRQPWSNGAIGATGGSYDGTAAELLASRAPPGLKAIAPCFSLHDVYADVALPGGILLSWFTENWGAFNRMLDSHDVAFALSRLLEKRFASKAIAAAAKPVFAAMVAGVRPVPGERLRLRKAVEDHAGNVDVHVGAQRVTHRDDRGISDVKPELTVDDFSPHAKPAANVPVMSLSGWQDAGYARAAIRRFSLSSRTEDRLVIGPWAHGGKKSKTPGRRSVAIEPAADAHVMAFLERHVRGVESDSARVRYFTTGEEAWKTASSWPPPGIRTKTFFPAKDGRLEDRACEDDSEDVYRVDSAAGTGEFSRWRGLLVPAVVIDDSDRVERDRRLLAWTSGALAAPLEMTGEARVSIALRCDADDCDLFAYLEEVFADGRVGLVTEGMLRALHRDAARTFRREHARSIARGEIAELRFDLLPTSHRFSSGSAIRLAIAGADRDHFVTRGGAPPELRIVRKRSQIELPVAG